MPAVDVTAYACVRDLPTLEGWIARAREHGLVAFDTETDSLSSANSALCGVSLAIRPGEACAFRSVIPRPMAWRWRRQIPLADAIAALKPLLEDPSVIKIAQNAKYDMAAWVALRD